MGEIKQINTKNRTCYFYNDRIDFKYFDKWLKRDWHLLHRLCDCWQNDNSKNINSVNPLYLMTDEMIGHFKEKNENKYLVLDDIDENKEVWKVVKKEIETTNCDKKIEYGKIF